MTTTSHAAAFLVAACLVLPAPLTAASRSETPLELVRDIFSEAPTDAERTESEVLAELGHLGGDAAEVLFRLSLAGGHLDSLLQPPPDHDRWWGRQDRYPDLCGRALVLHFPGKAEDLWREILGGDASLDERLAILRLSAGLASGRGFPLWLEVVSDLDEDELLSTIVRVTLRNSLKDHLEAGPAAFTSLADVLSEPVPPIVLDEVLKAVDSLSDPRAIAVLQRILEADAAGRETPPIEEVLPVLDRLHRAYPWVAGELWVEQLEELESDARLPVRRMAIQALAERPDAFSLLLDALGEQQEPDLAWTAQRALCRSFGLTARLEEAQWAHRVEREQDWWDDEGIALCDQLLESDLRSAGAALRELANRPALAQWSATRLSEMLPDLELTVARAVLGLLAELGRTEAVPGLVEALRYGDPSLEGEVALTLDVLTDYSLGRDPEAWANALSLEP